MARLWHSFCRWRQRAIWQNVEMLLKSHDENYLCIALIRSTGGVFDCLTMRYRAEKRRLFALKPADAPMVWFPVDITGRSRRIAIAQQLQRALDSSKEPRR